ncbi:MAG: AI-2E family transporter [Chloroflexota bacterium]
MSEKEISPPWTRSVKVSVAVVILIFSVFIIWQLQTLLSSIIIAAIVSYLLAPIIEFIDSRTRLSRGTVVGIVYLVLTLSVIGLFIYAGISAYRQVTNLFSIAPQIVEDIPLYTEQLNTFLTTERTIAGFTFSLPAINFDQNNVQDITSFLSGYIQPFAVSLGSSLGNVALGTATTIGNLVIILFVSIYITNDAPKLSSWIGDVAEIPGYRRDAERLWRDFGRIWQSYLRGQAILGIVIGLVVYFCMLILGVENPLALGLISGLMEFIPYIGPLIGAGAAILVAVFQETNNFGLTGIQFVILVTIVMSLIQQLENNFLVPRIVGDALDLNPLIVFVGALAGALFAGILGTVLAAPVIATIKLLGQYSWRKMFDLDPFPDPEKMEEDEPSWAESAWERWQLKRAGVDVDKKDEGTAESTEEQANG